MRFSQPAERARLLRTASHIIAHRGRGSAQGWRIVFPLAAAVVMLGSSREAAANDPCTLTMGGTVATCTGDQSNGISFSNPVTTLNVLQLTQPIAPAAGAAVTLSRIGATGTPLLVTIGSDVMITTSAVNAYGIQSFNVGDGSVLTPGGDVTVNNAGAITTQGAGAAAINVRSVASTAGGSGTTGRVGGAVTINNSGSIVTSGTTNDPNADPLTLAHGILALSIGSRGFAGAPGAPFSGDPGGSGGAGGALSITNTGSILTQGAGAFAVFAESLGASGGNGGNGSTSPGTGSDGGAGGSVTVTAGGSIATLGLAATGIYAASLGETGGTGGTGSGGARGGRGGVGGTVLVNSSEIITTSGDFAIGIWAQSYGGLGGKGGDGKFAGEGGKGGVGGSGGTVTVNSTGAISTTGFLSFGVLAESAGGNGNTGGKGSIRASGSGGAAAAGGAVSVTNGGAIATIGDYSSAVVAASVGGGGGGGGSAGGVIALGGSGGNGGDGGTVSLSNQGDIVTSGVGAYGQLALSVGGGGGNGGGAAGFIAIGGSGGLGGQGGNLTITNDGAIVTSGSEGHGVFAMSVGGGGGDGGYGASVAVGASVAIGGSGGPGGKGGNINLTNNGLIEVSGYGAIGVSVQSIGGGGGNGGDVLSTGPSFITLTMGGSGGTNRNAGGNIVLQNTGAILTSGDFGDAVFVQSVGGGGGRGGSAYSFSAGIYGSASIALGGTGGLGGDGGTVTITNSGVISTEGYGANGVFAQSLGGGGGRGGSATADALSVSPNTSVSIAVAVGGKGGGGGNGGAVSLTNTGAILTAGDLSDGIFAQSVGGGGGAGGASASRSVSAAPSGAYSAAISVGGSGGSGGTGGQVDVNNSGLITTQGYLSFGVMAQSIGGGGGVGADASAAETSIATNGSRGISIGVGGNGGTGNVGGQVTVNNSGNISVNGTMAMGIFAQSAGGGGGVAGAGSAEANDINASPGGAAKAISKKLFGVFSPADRAAAANIGIAVGIGGKGGSGNDGGTVTVTNSGSIQTSGFFGIGIFAQSIGGGGGLGGAAAANFSSLPLTTGNEVGGGVGGGAGSGGKGGNVTVTNHGSIATFGSDAYGIFAESVGGGGGLGASGSSGGGVTALNFAVGGQGGSSGDGGTVTVNQAGDIVTVGNRSFGVFAQSIGAGGGVGGAGNSTYAGKVILGGQGGSAGDGGAVNVNLTGNITTFGDGAYGVAAQSVGGGGGMSGDTAAKPISAGGLTVSPPFVGVLAGGSLNAGGGGDGGAVNVTSTGTIQTFGYAAHGIFAQSVGGGGGVRGGTSIGAAQNVIPFYGSNGDDGTAGAVTVAHTGSIEAFGANSYAIFAQSIDKTTLGNNISVTVNGGGTVLGGSGNGAAIYLDGGAVNTINIGSGSTVLALSGMAIKMTEPAFATVNNSGTVIGNVDVTNGVASFNNSASAVFQPTTTVNLGGGTLTNNGMVNLGGNNNVVTTALTGNYVQSTTGTLAADVRIGSTPSDILNVSGTANVRGLVKPYALYLAPNATATIVNATGGFTGTNDATAVNNQVATYGLQYVGNTLQISVLSVNLLPPAFAGSLNANQTSVANHLQGVWNTGVASSLGAAIGYLSNFTTGNGFAAALDQLHPQPYLAQSTGAMTTGLGFIDGMMSCRGAEGALAPLRERECTWMKVGGGVANQQSNADTAGYRETGERYQVGIQQKMAPDFFRGFAVSFEGARTTAGNATTDAQRADLGLSLKHQWGNWLFAGALDVGAATLDTSRAISVGGSVTAKSRASVWHADARFRAVYLIEAGRNYLKPSVDLDLIQVYMPSFSETGAGPLNLQVNAMSQTIGAITPALEFGATLQGNDAATVMRPFISGGVSMFSSSNWNVTSTFAGSPAGVSPLVTTSAFPATIYKASAGVEFVSTRPVGGLDMRFVYDGQFASGFQSHTGSVKAIMRF